MNGLKRNDLSFYVAKIPERKKPCLFVEQGNKSYKVGQFNDWQTAEEFMTILEYVCFGNCDDKAHAILSLWNQLNFGGE